MNTIKAIGEMMVLVAFLGSHVFHPGRDRYILGGLQLRIVKLWRNH